MPEAFPECNPTRNAPVRALNAVYQNITAKSMLVIVSVSCAPTALAAAFVQAQIDPTTPPATVVAEAGAPAGVAMTLHERIYGFAATLATSPGVRVLNPEWLGRLSPLGQRHDLSSELRWGFPYHLEHTSALCDLLAELLWPAPPKKAIITDLDETLWRGVLGEDGVDGISWDLDHSSHAHALYQGMLASLADLGVLIGVAS